MRQRRYCVFVSSTFKDLENHRKIAVDTILRAGNFPICMELFHANAKHNFEYIGNKIAESDIFILMLGENYGEIVTGDGRSFTHFEYDQAVRLGKPILYFMLDKADFDRGDRPPQLTQFRNKVYSQGRFINHFPMSPPDAIASRMMSALNSECDTLDAKGFTGWIKAEEYDRLKLLKFFTEDQSVSPIFQKIIEQFSKLKITLAHSADHAEQKLLSAKYFWSEFQTPILFNKAKSIFFEAGSTVDAFSSYILHLMSNFDHLRVDEPKVNFYFNGVLSKVLFDLRDKNLPMVEQIAYLPDPPILSEYGKTVGSLAAGPYETPRSYSTVLNADEMERVSNFSAELASVLASNSVSIISFSGFDASDGFAPYIRHHRNFLFKRAIFEIDTDIVISLTGDKVSGSWRKTDDHFKVFDSDEWETIHREKSICYVFTEIRPECCDGFVDVFLAKLGFQYISRDHGDGNVSYICYNSIFEASLMKR